MVPDIQITAGDGASLFSETHKRSKGRVPKKIHKSEREKLKREHLNDLFLELDEALDPGRHSNGKASILIDATRLLREMIAQVDSLKRENAALESESKLVALEKNELEEEKENLEQEILTLQDELARVGEVTAHPFYVLPLIPEMQSASVTKPLARYPSSADSWPEKILSGGN